MILAVLAAVVLTFTGVIGGATLLVFGDVIVFVLIIVLIAKLFKRRKK
jgi:hypothetical protein